jgi:hypothetical protein
MANASSMATGVFVATVVGVAAVIFYGLAREGRLAVALGVLALWLVPPAVAARAGVLDRYDSVPPPVFLMVATYTVATSALAFSRLGDRLIVSLGLAGVIGLQGFRIAVEWVLHRLYLDGAIPVQMTYAGRNFDIVSGVTGAALGLWLLLGRPVSKGVAAAWNVLGLALLVNIVTIAILSTPVPFRAFMNEPANRLPGVFPFVWLPMFLVQVALLGHLLVFRMLRSSRRFRGRARM